MRRGRRARALAVALVVAGLLAGPARAVDPPPRDGELVMAPDGSLYLIQGGQKRPFEPVPLSSTEVAAIPEGSPVPDNLIPLAPGAEGPGAAGAPAFAGEISPITFGTSTLGERRIANPSRRFPAGTREVFASFTATGVKAGDVFTALWLLNGSETSRGDFQFDEQERNLISIANDQGLYEGNYELQILIGGQPVAWGFFVVGESPRAGRITSIEFATNVDDHYRALDPATRFPRGVREIYVVFGVEDIPEGTVRGWRWLHNGRAFAVFDSPWKPELAIDGSSYLRYDAGPDGLEDGRYDVTLVLNSAPVQRAVFTVGGQR